MFAWRGPDGQNRSAVVLNGEHQAGDSISPQQGWCSATNPDRATLLGNGQGEIVAKQVESNGCPALQFAARPFTVSEIACSVIPEAELRSGVARRANRARRMGPPRGRSVPLYPQRVAVLSSVVRGRDKWALPRAVPSGLLRDTPSAPTRGRAKVEARKSPSGGSELSATIKCRDARFHRSGSLRTVRCRRSSGTVPRGACHQADERRRRGGWRAVVWGD